LPAPYSHSPEGRGIYSKMICLPGLSRNAGEPTVGAPCARHTIIVTNYPLIVPSISPPAKHLRFIPSRYLVPFKQVTYRRH
jgi:hypothetical protein